MEFSNQCKLCSLSPASASQLLPVHTHTHTHAHFNCVFFRHWNVGGSYLCVCVETMYQITAIKWSTDGAFIRVEIVFQTRTLSFPLLNGIDLTFAASYHFIHSLR